MDTSPIIRAIKLKLSGKGNKNAVANAVLFKVVDKKGD